MLFCRFLRKFRPQLATRANKLRDSIQKSALLIFLALNLAFSESTKIYLPPKLNETFSAILTLEDLYFNEHAAYAPDLRTLRSSFEVKDSLEYFVPDHEIYVSTRENNPLLFAVDLNGDSIVQVGKEPPYPSPLKQNEYRADFWWGISLRKPLEVGITLDSDQSFKGRIRSQGKDICSFSAKRGKHPAVQGCSDYISVEGSELVVILPSTLLRAGAWEAILTPSRGGEVKGQFASQGGRKYPIRGYISKKTPLKILGNP